MNKFHGKVKEDFGINNEFSFDGPIDSKKWGSETLRILILGKETYGWQGNENCQIMDNLESWNKSKFTLNSTRLVHAIMNYLIEPNLLSKLGIMNIQEKELKETYSELAIVEVKKTSNGGGIKTSSDREVRDFSRKYANALREQIILLNPNLIICCGQVVFDSYAYDMGFIPHIKNRTEKEIYTSNGMVVVNSYHPSSQKFNYESILEKLVRLEKKTPSINCDFQKLKKYIPIRSKIVHRDSGKEFITGSSHPLFVFVEGKEGLTSIRLLTRRFAGFSHFYPMQDDWVFEQWMYKEKTFSALIEEVNECE